MIVIFWTSLEIVFCFTIVTSAHGVKSKLHVAVKSVPWHNMKQNSHNLITDLKLNSTAYLSRPWHAKYDPDDSNIRRNESINLSHSRGSYRPVTTDIDLRQNSFTNLSRQRQRNHVLSLDIESEQYTSLYINPKRALKDRHQGKVERFFFKKTIAKVAKFWDKFIDKPIRCVLDRIKNMFTYCDTESDDCFEKFKQVLKKKIHAIIVIIKQPEKEGEKIGVNTSECTSDEKTQDIEKIEVDIVDNVKICLEDKVTMIKNFMNNKIDTVNNSKVELDELHKRVEECQNANEPAMKEFCLSVVANKVDASLETLPKELQAISAEAQEYILNYKPYFLPLCTEDELAEVNNQGEVLIEQTSDCIKDKFPELSKVMERSLNASSVISSSILLVLKIIFIQLFFTICG